MADWLIKFISDTYTVEVELLDSFGPLNQWRSRKTGAFTKASGQFTNQTRNAVDVEGDWELSGLDIDDTMVGQSGNGLCKTSVGDFPEGTLHWVVHAHL